MKPAHRNKVQTENKDWLQIAVHHEREGEFDQAARAYNKFLTLHPTNTEIYNKLMRLHRDLKEYEKELTVINKAIKALEKFYKDQKPSYNKKVATLSKALLKATGLGDTKGNNLYEPPDIVRWKKRRSTVMKKLGLE